MIANMISLSTCAAKFAVALYSVMETSSSGMESRYEARVEVIIPLKLLQGVRRLRDSKSSG
jgi:hypothetical protein